MYPLKFHPILKERLWGGTKLREVLGKQIENDITGESWELSAVQNDISVVSNGNLSGISLQELIDKRPEDLLGKNVVGRFGHKFPILIKFIDAKQDLSVQVHPNDELAKKRHDSNGKTEMWYIMDADKEANLIIGFNRNISKEEYKRSIETNMLLDLVNYEKVEEGDAFFINSGRIHAIGAGVLLAEIQQTSDITYRVFDFNRKDKDGNYRELHTEQALEALDYDKKDDFKARYSKKKDQVNILVHSQYFKTDYIDLTKNMERDVSKRDSFTIYMCVQGAVNIENDYGSASCSYGQTVLVPACSKKIHLRTNGAKLLEVTV